MADYRRFDYRPLGPFGSASSNDQVLEDASDHLRAMRRLGLDVKALQAAVDMALTMNQYIFRSDDRDERGVR